MALILFFIILYQLGRNIPVTVALSFPLFLIGWRSTAALFTSQNSQIQFFELDGLVIKSYWTSEVYLATTILVLFFFALIIPRSGYLEAYQLNFNHWYRSLSTFFFVSGGLSSIILYIEMLGSGALPLFEGMERGFYTENYGGPAHHLFLEHGRILCFWLGFFFIAPAMAKQKVRLEFLLIIVSFLIYLVFVGHRFSMLYQMISFFVMPTAMLFLFGGNEFSAEKRRVLLFLLFLGFCVAFLMAFGIANSYLNVRMAGDVQNAFLERMFYQPIELWWLTWESIREDVWNPVEAIFFVYVDPPVAGKNSGNQFLMIKALGYDRAFGLLEQGQTFQGGFPEIIFELLGPIWAWPAICLIAAITALTAKITLLAALKGKIITATASLFIYLSMCLVIISGMANIFMTWTYFVKLAAMVIGWFLEPSLFEIKKSLVEDGVNVESQSQIL